MAESEIYRVEIPIIVDDQTDAPLKQAERKISKFEKSAQMETERIRKHFQHIAKYQIEPVMKVRDQLTSGVLKADRLIRKLDMAQASPLIAAQDRVSAVVTRINAILDALDKGKVDVVAEMQGPLFDEIIKAKAALSALNNVKAGPIAELRGELFGQLTKAMSQIKGLDLARAEPQATLRERVTWKVKEVSSSLRGLTSRAWNVTLQIKDEVSGVLRGITGGVRRVVSLLTSPLTLLGVGGGIGGLTKLGIDMVVERENITMAFETLLGSADAAAKRIEELTEFAGQTPFLRDEIYESSRILEVFTRGALSTSKGLKLVGDVAAGTGQEYKDVALWVGRLYDAMASGRPVGEMTARLQEMGAISGEQRAMLEQLAKSGKNIAYTWPQAEKVFSRFEGQMERMSTGLGNMLTSVKSFFRETVLLRWGKGIEAELRPLLERFRQWRREHPEQVKAIGDKIERIARTSMKHIVDFGKKGYGRLKEFWASISADPNFQNLSFGDKIIYVLNLALDEVSAWLDSEGGMKLQETFTKLGEIGAKAWIAGLKGAFKGAVSSAAHGNLVGAGAMLGLASMLGGGLVLRGAWGLGKGLFGAGKWALGKLGLGSAGATAAGVAAETAATASGVGAASRVLPILGRARPWIGRIGLPIATGLEAINIARAEDKKAAAILGTGRIAGMIAGGKAGAVAGGAVGGLFGGVGAAPGAVIGGILGGIGGLFGGQALADRVNEWIDGIDFGRLKTRAIKTWEEVKESASSAWNWIKENFTLESIAEKAGYVVGYLESTIFSSEWWLEKWENVKAWAADKWATMSEVWQSTKETINSTIFNTEWWGTQWGSVKSWTAGKWDEMKTVWETVKSDISSTLFSKTWWESKWENVKTWASGA